jgi:hypothetical protein
MKTRVRVIASLVSLSAFLAISAIACTQAPPSAIAPTNMPVSPSPQNFVLVTSDVSSVVGLHQFDLAFNAGTGRICKTWKWTLAGDTALNSIPECYEMLRKLNKKKSKRWAPILLGPQAPFPPNNALKPRSN